MGSSSRYSPDQQRPAARCWSKADGRQARGKRYARSFPRRAPRPCAGLPMRGALLTPVPARAMQGRLTTREISRADLRAGVALWHRHLPRARPGEVARFGVYDASGRCRGVASVGRPAARLMMPGVLEVDRVATDGAPNACSALYGAAARWCARHRRDVQWLVTYTLKTEPGTSLTAAGWIEDARYKGAARRSWAGPNRARSEREGLVAGVKRRWWLPLCRAVHPVQWLPEMARR